MKTFSAICASVLTTVICSCNSDYHEKEIVCPVSPLGPQSCVVVIDLDNISDETKTTIGNLLDNEQIIRSPSETADIDRNEEGLFDGMQLDMSEVDFSTQTVLLSYYFLSAVPSETRFHLINIVDDNCYRLSTVFVHDTSDKLPDNQIALIRTAVVTDRIPADAEVVFQYGAAVSDLWN